MKIEGYFPASTFRANSSSTRVFRKSDFGFVGTVYVGGSAANNSSLHEEAAWLTNRLLSIIASAPVASGKSFSPDFLGGYAYAETGMPTPIPAPVMLSSPLIKSSNGKRWRNRLRTQDIIVSDYQQVQMYLEFVNGGTKTSGRVREQLVTNFSIAKASGVPPRTVTVGKSTITYYDFGHPFLVFSDGGAILNYVSQSREDNETAFEAGFNIEVMQDYLDNLKWPVDPASEVTKTYAEANMATLDLLTSVAELPETMKSAYNGLKFMLKGLKDVKAKRLSLLSKTKKVREEYERRVFRLEYNSRKEFIAARNERTRALINRKARLKKEQLKHDFQKTLQDLTDSVAAVWLNYRYNIEPTRMMIEDLVDTLLEPEKVFFRKRSLVVTEMSLPKNVVAPSKTANAEQRVCVKRLVFPGGTQYSQHLAVNPFVTAWELVPFSFVIDWIVNVGDFIASAVPAYLTKSWREGATLSLKVDDVCIYNLPNGSKVNVRFKGYKRQTIHPSDYCRLTFDPDISPVRQADAIALAWRIFMDKSIWKSK